MRAALIATILVTSTVTLSAQHAALAAFLERGHFSEAVAYIESLDDSDAPVLISAALTIDSAHGPLPRWQHEHLLRLVLENVLDSPTSASDDAAAGGVSDDRLAGLEPILLQASAFENAQLRRTIFELGAGAVETSAWRNELQRRGEKLVDELKESAGRPGADVVEESIALLHALAATDDSRLITLVDRIRRESRVRTIVEAAREASARLRKTPE